MGHPRPFRFGLQASGPMSAREWTELAQKAEDLGYSTLTCADHLDDQFGPVPALAAAAMATTTLRLGTLVLANDYRHPVVTAKDAATLDVLSDGRLELGIGAGWMTSDYEASGIPLDRPGVRIERMAEGLAVIQGLFADGPLTFEGEHYRIQGLEGIPKPVQRPGPPIVIGGGGPRVLQFAAQHADIVGINVNLAVGVIDDRAGSNGTEEVTQAKIDLVREAAGDRYDSIELQVRVHVVAVTEDRQGVAELLAPALGISPAASLASPHALAGSVEEITDDLLARRERWDLSYLGVSADALDALAPVVARLAGT